MKSKIILAILPLIAVIVLANGINNSYAVNTSENPRDTVYSSSVDKNAVYAQWNYAGNISDNPRNPPDHSNNHRGFTNDPICGDHICASGEGAPVLSDRGYYGGYTERKHIATE